MYNAFKYQQEIKIQEEEAAKVKPLRETNPVLAAKRTQRMSDNSK